LKTESEILQLNQNDDFYLFTLILWLSISSKKQNKSINITKNFGKLVH